MPRIQTSGPFDLTAGAGMGGGNGGLRVEGTDVITRDAAFEMMKADRDEALVPLGTILRIEQDQIAFGIVAGGEAG